MQVMFIVNSFFQAVLADKLSAIALAQGQWKTHAVDLHGLTYVRNSVFDCKLS